MDSVIDKIDHSLNNICGPTESLGLALDVIIVVPAMLKESDNDIFSSAELNDDSGIVASSDFLVQFPHRSIYSSDDFRILIQINGNNLQESFLSMTLPKEICGNSGTNMCKFRQGGETKPPTAALFELVEQQIITPGRNLLRFILVRSQIQASINNMSDQDGKDQPYVPLGSAEACIFLWSVHDKIIITDIDGTLTKSDVRGAFDSIVMQKFSHVHENVCSFFNDLSQYRTTLEDNSESLRGKVRIVYLSSRPMKLIKATKKFIYSLSQFQSERAAGPEGDDRKTVIPCMAKNDDILNAISSGNNTVNLPPGPIFLQTDSLSTVFMTEFIRKTTHEFKADTLARQIVLPFVAAGQRSTTADLDLFLAGFGNRKTDLLAYEMVGLRRQNIYIINKKSVLESTAKAMDSGDIHQPLSIYLPRGHRSWNNGIADDKDVICSSNLKRIFLGYGDPSLKTELMLRLKLCGI